ncbi:hypothetical protein CRYUN_Cryun37aG0088400 [Craigia yunnanensis]
MPSGSKKRKAAKKKKEQVANDINSSTNNNLHGNDDPKSQDERDSDGGDVGSPASQDDHNHQHPFSKEEEEGKREPSLVQSHVTEDKYVEEATRDAERTEKSGLDDVGVKIEKEWEPKEDLESRHVPIQHVEHDKCSSSSSSRSSRSNSDDESQAFEKKSKEEAYNLGSKVTSYSNEDKSATVISEEVLKVAENEMLGDIESNSAVQTAAVDNLVKPVLSVTEEVDHDAEISANKSVSDVVESGLKESEEKLLPSSNGNSRVELEGNEGKISPSSVTPTAESSNVAEKTQDSEPHDYSEKQPLVASTPPVVQRSSLLSCCGLFDVFTGSGR